MTFCYVYQQTLPRINTRSIDEVERFGPPGRVR